MDIQTWLTQAKRKIDPLDAELIALRNFAPRLADRSWLVAHSDQKIAEMVPRADRMVQKRSSGVPLAYILGEKEFYGRKFWVQPGVLIPRPETEALVDLVKSLPDLPKRPNFLEIGAGSGCLSVTLALEFSQATVMASDISVRALETAERNDLTYEGRVEFVESNLLKDFDFEEYPEHFDVLVANLPYVDKDWDWVNLDNLAHEPASALFAKGNHGLSMYQRLLREINHYSDPNALWLDYLVLEADPCQHAQLIRMAEKAGFTHLKTEGYGLLFEDRWRYWYDDRAKGYVRKPQAVIAEERKTGQISFIPEEREINQN